MLPNLIVIGAMKSGTTSLHHYLNLHPEIQMSRQKELNFFVEDQNWQRGVDWYKSHFSAGAKVRGESSPMYSNFPIWEGVPQRMASVIPDAKIIYLVRDPVERIVSQYTHFYADQIDSRSFAKALATLPGNIYINRSRYFFQISQYLEFFPSENILIVTSESLSQKPRDTMRKIFQFLAVDPHFEFEFKLWRLRQLLTFGWAIASPDFHYDMKMHRSVWKRRLRIAPDHFAVQALNRAIALLPSELACHAQKVAYWPLSRRVDRPAVDDELRLRVFDHLREDLERLQDYTGYDFAEWNIPIHLQ